MKADSTTIVIFGASGDLGRRKLIPALFSLYNKKKLSSIFRIVGFARSVLSDSQFRESVRVDPNQSVNCEVSDMINWDTFANHLFYTSGQYSERNDFVQFRSKLAELEKAPSNRLYYLAIPPHFIKDIVTNLGKADMVREEKGWQRVIVEKPFGHNLKSAQSLNQILHKVLDENQIYRIDHYLGKETVQNVLVFRFGNTVFEPIWNRNYIDNVQITMAESVDVGHRAGYYDNAGVLRDMFQNHMLQLLTLVAMEPPASFDADAIRNEKVKLLSALRLITANMVEKETVRAQYEGYRQTEGVDPESNTATYAALRLFIDNWRWKGVPFYLRSGKALQKKVSEIIIEFKEPPHVMFPLPEGARITSNKLSLRIQPNEGIQLCFEAKVPDTVAGMRTVNMDFQYSSSFGNCSIPDAYERLLLDTLQGDASLFTRSDGIEMSWQFIDNILEGWETKNEPPMAIYKPSSWGPDESDAFIARDGRKWLNS